MTGTANKTGNKFKYPQKKYIISAVTYFADAHFFMAALWNCLFRIDGNDEVYEI